MREDPIWQGFLPIILHGYFVAGDMNVGIGPKVLKKTILSDAKAQVLTYLNASI
jgi:hypothetical protein